MNARPIKFAVRIHQGGYSYEALREIWKAADRLGYHSATLYDLLNAPALECWTTLSALATETERIRLTPLVLANLYRHPAALAKMASTLDVISGGRLELGIGAGGSGGDHRASGIPFPSTSVRVEMLEEAIEIVTRLWSLPNVSYRGRHYSLEGATNDPKPVQKPWPPILVGGHGERYLMRAAAKYSDICNIGFEMNLEEHRSKRAVLEQHCLQAERDIADIEITHNARVLVGSDRHEYERLVETEAAKRGVPVEEYRAGLGGAVAGTPDECLEQLSRYVAAGITYFFLLFPDPISVDSLELFAREVMPHF